MKTTIIINHQPIQLSIVNQSGICFHCQLDKEIRLTSYHQQTKNYCWSCALHCLYRLEQSNHQIANKQQIITELRAELNNLPAKKWSDYYSCHKPNCFACQELGIKKNDYNFCSDNCLILNWIKYQGASSLVNK